MADKSIIEELRGRIASIETGNGIVPKSKPVAKQRGRRNTSERDLASANDAFEKIVALVNASDKSELAIRNRLSGAGYTESAIEDSIDRAKSCGFIDDMRFASVLIRSRLAQGKGIPGIERELRSQNIDLQDVPGWPEEFDANFEAEFDRALTFIHAHPPRSKNQREGAYRKLIAKGYSSATASSVARTWFEQSLER